MLLRFEPLGAHSRAAFSSGDRDLDDWFHTRAGQDERRDVARVFVAIDDEIGVSGFYTLSAFAVAPGDFPAEASRRLPRYETIPCALIGRLARDERRRGQGLGAELLADAIARVLETGRSVAVHAIVVDAKNSQAADFYASFEFLPFPSRPLRLFLPVATAAKAARA